MKTKNKYHNKKCEWNGEKFDSQKELKYYKYLLEEQEKGNISNLQRQVKYELIPTQHYNNKTYRKCCYYADFTYNEPNNEKLVVIDTKGITKGRSGTSTDTFIVKQKMLIYRYGNEIDFRIV